MLVPRKWLLPTCAVLAAAAYFLMLFTGLGNYFHGGSPWGRVILDATVVLAAFGCWEVFRTEKVTPVRAVAAAVGSPLALFVLLTLWYGLKRHVAP